MKLLPWQFHEVNNNFLITNESGSFFYCKENTLNKLINKDIYPVVGSFLKTKTLFEDVNDKYWNNYLFNLYKENHHKRSIT